MSLLWRYHVNTYCTCNHRHGGRPCLCQPRMCTGSSVCNTGGQSKSCAAPRSPHTAPRGSPTSSPGYLKDTFPRVLGTLCVHQRDFENPSRRLKLCSLTPCAFTLVYFHFLSELSAETLLNLKLSRSQGQTLTKVCDNNLRRYSSVTF